jgi:hypothetical protein
MNPYNTLRIQLFLSEARGAMTKTITLRIPDTHYQVFRDYAQKRNQKISNAIETLALKQLESAQFVGGLEMEGILADRELLARIERGTKQANAKKGRFVE